MLLPIRHSIFIFLIILPAFSIHAEQPNSWIIYNGADILPEAFRDYDMMVMDGKNHIALRALLAWDKTILARVSLGQIHESDPDFQQVKDANILIAPSSDKPGFWFVDIRQDFWPKLILEQIIPEILHDRFTGLMLDSLEQIMGFEQNNPKYKGLSLSAVHLIQAIRMHYSTMLMINCACDLIHDIAPYADMIVGESLFSFYDPKTKTYQLQPNQSYKIRIQKMREIQKTNPHIGLYSLDYWNPDDLSMIEKIVEEEKKSGVIPYVGNFQLDHVKIQTTP
ncbi:MAG: endo alpha-1,4 polygalactosaminidase [SAR324 cluster bacterium]|nr:endo alpha-1,4 polygalactosaminidase [SAR324 cluster bacterium]MBF0349789.1 endo alpha-1,4 polygalactosaminidase [SAR324 cluster bacterium]